MFIVEKSDLRPGEETATTACPELAAVANAVYELTTDMFPALMTTEGGAVMTVLLAERIWTVMSRCALAGFPVRSVSAMTRRPVQEVAGRTH